MRWAVLATGGIANAFARSIRHVPNATIGAVVSRSNETARAFAARHGVPFATTDLAAALQRSDALYVASPHPFHAAAVRAALDADVAVLCEKPLTMTAAEARELAALARERRVFLMEAVWMRFVPAVRRARELIAAGRIGAVRRLCAEFAINAPFDGPGFGENHRLYAPALGGGALHDLGVYPIHLALSILGAPDDVTAGWKAAPTGVDAEADLRFDYADGRIAYLTCGFGEAGANLAVIEGERGSIVLDTTFIGAQRLWVVPNALAPLFGFARTHGPAARFRALARRIRLPGIERIDLPWPDDGLQFEIAAAMEAIADGRIEHPDAPLADTVLALEIIENALARPPG